MLAYLQGCGARLESPAVKGMDAVATGTYEPSGSVRSVVIGLDHDLVDDGGSVSSVPSESISAMTHSTMMGSPFATGFGGSNGLLGPVDDYVGGITPPSRSGILDSIDSVDSPMSATGSVSASYYLGEDGDDNGTGEGDVFAGVSTMEPSRGSFVTPPLFPMVEQEPVPNRRLGPTGYAEWDSMPSHMPFTTFGAAVPGVVGAQYEDRPYRSADPYTMSPDLYDDGVYGRSLI